MKTKKNDIGFCCVYVSGSKDHEQNERESSKETNKTLSKPNNCKANDNILYHLGNWIGKSH